MNRLLDMLSRSIEKHDVMERRISALTNRKPPPITRHASPVPPGVERRWQLPRRAGLGSSPSGALVQGEAA